MSEKDESKLKKTFRERDVNRMRNIITKKFGESTGTQIGYNKIDEFHNEGDIWIENGKEWIIKDGIKQSNTRLDDFKKLVMMPLLCPNCHHPMKNKFDKKLFPLHGKCFDCVIKMETKLRMEGKYEEYAKNIIAGNMTGFIKDARDFVLEFANEIDISYYTEQGDKETFYGKENKEKMINEWVQELNEMEKTIESKLKPDEKIN